MSDFMAEGLTAVIWLVLGLALGFQFGGVWERVTNPRRGRGKEQENQEVK